MGVFSLFPVQEKSGLSLCAVAMGLGLIHGM